MIKTNFHTHTSFCDGKNSPEEMILTAIGKGFTALGFSIHSYTDGDIDPIVSKEGLENYYKTLRELQVKYKDQIEILCGIEQDVYSPPFEYDYDYVIGGAHYFRHNDKLLYVDRSLEDGKKNFLVEYKGDFDAYAKDYYAVAKTIVEKTNPSFIAHIDLVTKFIEKLDIKLTDRYFEYAIDAVDYLVKFGVPFEINTGAISRGYRTSPYPHLTLLKRIKEKGGKIVISSDCHNKDYLDCGFDIAEDMARHIGFNEHYVVTKNGMKKVSF